MKPLQFLITVLALSCSSLGGEPAAPLRFPEEQTAWTAMAARFSEEPTVKSDSSKTIELAVAGLRGKEKGAGSASILVDKATGHVVEVTSNAANFRDEEFAYFGTFTELRALTLWHNSNFTGVGLAKVAKLPQLQRITLAGGSLDDAGMAELAKITTMHELRAWHAKFSDAGIALLRGHPALESIKVGPSWEPLLTDKTLEHLAECPKLTKLGIAETWLTWEGGFRHLVKRKDQLAEIDLGNCIIDAADVERLRGEMPGAKVIWNGLAAAGAELQKEWLRIRAEKWIPKELVGQALAASRNQRPE
ncbi:MAG: hypothetical protein QOE70_3764 [Chthoniobacter sp.]|jgi:hypothetical protein|nr:hypothetical protein [Chthoniobacter sp.]